MKRFGFIVMCIAIILFISIQKVYATSNSESCDGFGAVSETILKNRQQGVPYDSAMASLQSAMNSLGYRGYARIVLVNTLQEIYKMDNYLDINPDDFYASLYNSCMHLSEGSSK